MYKQSVDIGMPCTSKSTSKSIELLSTNSNNELPIYNLTM